MDQPYAGQAGSTGRLKICGVVGSTEVRRGMTIFDPTGEPVGLVAGVVVAAGSELISDVVISRVPTTGEYWLAPAGLVTSVGEDRLSLLITAAALETLPRHTPE